MSFYSNGTHMFFVICLFGLLVSFNDSLAEDVWSLAGATWYGEPSGAGSTGGACGYADAVEKKPFNSMIAAGGPSIYNSGKGCGVCYQVKCTKNVACSGSPVTIVVTDECPGCTSEAAHFDLSGTAFSAMAKPGQGDQLRNAGVLSVQYKRTPCNYGTTKITIAVDAGSNPYYLAFAVEFGDGAGNLSAVEIQQGRNWLPMQEMRSAVWRLNSGSPLKGPFTIRLTDGLSHNVVVATNVLPADWTAGRSYESHVNFGKKI